MLLIKFNVKGDDLKNDEVISPLLICFLIALSIEVDVSLWDNAAAMFKISYTLTPPQQSDVFSAPISKPSQISL